MLCFKDERWCGILAASGTYVREIAPPNGAEGNDASLLTMSRLGVSYDEGGEGLGDPTEVAQASQCYVTVHNIVGVGL